MAQKNYWIKAGFWSFTNKDQKDLGGLNLRKVIKWALRSLQVPFYDECCPTDIPFNSTKSEQVLTGAGAVSLETYNTYLVTTGANALTLAAGSQGQEKFIKMRTDGGDGTLTVTNLQGGTTITFNDAGDFVKLYYSDNKWNILTNSGTTVA